MRDCFAAAAMGPTEALSSSQPIMSPMFPIVTSILDIKEQHKIRVREQRERETTWAFV